VYPAIYAEVNAKLKLQAAALGAINFLTEAEAALAAASTESQVQQAWDLWCQSVGPLQQETPYGPGTTL